MQAQLIDDVLDVSASSPEDDVPPVPVELGPVLQAAMTTVHPAVVAEGIEVLASVPPRLHQILGDEGRLQQIIWNLLSNAVKFTTKGGTDHRARPRIGRCCGSRWRIREEDRPAYLPHVFEPFTPEDARMTRSHEGIGLGLRSLGPR